MRYDPHERLIDPARPSRSLIRLGIGFVASIVLLVAIARAYGRLQYSFVPEERHATFYDELSTGSTATAVLINLFGFAMMILSLWVVLWVVHRRGMLSLIGPLDLAVRQFVRVVGAVAILFGVLFILPAPDDLTLSLNTELDRWLVLLPLAATALFVQVFAEELVFRGYLQSQLAARFRQVWVWMLVPTAIFGLLHFGNAGGSALGGWLMVAWAAGFGIAAADLTARSGTLGPATALHFVNNFTAILLMAPDGNFDGLALYTFPFEMADSSALVAWMPVEMMVLLCAWLTARLALRL